VGRDLSFDGRIKYFQNHSKKDAAHAGHRHPVPVFLPPS
jgi:hypothetical protein